MVKKSSLKKKKKLGFVSAAFFAELPIHEMMS